MGKVYIVFIEHVCVSCCSRHPVLDLRVGVSNEWLAEAWLVGGCGVDARGLCVVVCVFMEGVVCCIRAYVPVRAVVCLCLYACLFLCIAAQCDCVHASVFEYPRSKAQNKFTHSL